MIPLTLSLLCFEETLKEKNEYLSPELHGGASYCAVYRDNCMEFRKVRHNPTLYVSAPDKVELYEVGYELHKTTGSSVFPVAEQADCYFENAVTNQWNLSYLDNYKYKVILKLEQENPDYICVIKDSSYYLENQDYFEQYQKIYENPSGFIAVFTNH